MDPAENERASDRELIPVTVEKSHIITIGEKLYAESIEFIREIVNNAYDADATAVEIAVTGDAIEIRDNGTGMDREGLVQYFSIGSQEKLLSPVSPVLGRRRIGQFGIGKFATLAACREFEVTTRKGEFVGRVVFDKQKWEKSPEDWRLVLERPPLSTRPESGTTVVLRGLNRTFFAADLEVKIIEGTPLKAPDFRVKLNGRTLRPRSYSGHKIPILDGTDHGAVSGEIVILPESASPSDRPGIDIKVKGVTVTRELFGMVTWGKTASRIRGEINADFLPVTSDRTGFIKDSPEYRQFTKVMERVVRDIRIVLQRLGQKRESRRAGRALREAIDRITRALEINPDLSPSGPLPAGDGTRSAGLTAAAEEPGKKAEEGGKEKAGARRKKSPPAKQAAQKKPSVRRLTPGAVVRKMKLGRMGVSCCIDGFGEDGPEAFSEETVIYINKDHPFYRRESSKKDTHVLNLARLITQEIALMKELHEPRQAFDRQSKLLKAAFVDRE